MRLALTPAQVEEIRPFLKHGETLLARIDREQFTGLNGATAGTPYIDLGAVPTSALPSLRQAIIDARNPKPKKTKRTPKTP